MKFRWNEWNLEHATKHGVQPQEAESVVRSRLRGYPRAIGDGKFMVHGRGVGGRFVQVLYVLDADGTRYVIQAMPLSRR